MEAGVFDQTTRRIAAGATRRRVAGVLGGLALPPLLGIAVTGAKTKKSRKKPYCLSGTTVQASGKKGKKLRKQGATSGACCVPSCNGTSCGGSDGCGGTCGCASGAVCHEGACKVCTITCTGTPQACGAQLQQALLNGGTVVACPGRYRSAYAVGEPTTLIGAGPGDDPATSTILDAFGSGTSALQVVGAFVFTMSGVTITGAPLAGLVIFGSTTAQVRNCTIAGNATGGIAVLGALQLANSTVSNNQSTEAGAGISFSGAGPHAITNCVISGNTSTASETFDGGGGFFTVNSASVTVTATEIRGNQAKRGGGIAMETGTVRLDNATSITGNAATETGGGVARQGGDFQQNGATITGNTSPISSTANCAGVPGGCS